MSNYHQNQSAPYTCPATSGASAAVGPNPTSTGYVYLSGVSLGETAGTATRVEIRDQQSATGNVVAVINLAANGSSPYGYLPNIRVAGGIYVKLVGAGTVAGSVFLR